MENNKEKNKVLEAFTDGEMREGFHAILKEMANMMVRKSLSVEQLIALNEVIVRILFLVDSYYSIQEHTFNEDAVSSIVKKYTELINKFIKIQYADGEEDTSVQ